MLVLSRRSHESVMVENPDGSGSTLKVTVIRCRDGEVRLGFEGPARLTIHRLEIWNRIRADVQANHPTNSPRRKRIQRTVRRDVQSDRLLYKFDLSKGN